MIVVVPARIPPRVPVPMPIVPLAGVLLAHVPPAGVPVSVVAEPSHTCNDPLIPVGSGFINTTAVRKQPVGSV